MLHVREQYRRWGKDKLAVVVRRAGWTVPTSMVGHILAKLKARGVLREAPLAAISTRKRAFRRPYAVRKPKGYARGPARRPRPDGHDWRQLLLPVVLPHRGMLPKSEPLESTPTGAISLVAAPHGIGWSAEA